jgi:hypothetical protein
VTPEEIALWFETNPITLLSRFKPADIEGGGRPGVDMAESDHLPADTGSRNIV